ncbi:MAG: ABC transporter permease [Pirellulaceae bacterium]|jgi:peptide/nickel transport system permease protein|nr:ABC transporter permease [Pirellulaceae bacterium]
MTIYLIRRLLLGFVTLVVVTAIVYALIRHMPGTPLTMAAENMDPSRKISDEDYALMKKAYGLDKDWYVAYFYWIGNVARGDLGASFRERKPVAGVILQRVGPTLLLSGLSIVITYIVSVPIGLYSTMRSGKLDERTTSVLLYVLYSLPTYVAALQLLVIFYLRLKGTDWQLKPGMVSDDYVDLSPVGKLQDIGAHLILPLICFTYGSLAYYSRFVKANMEEAIRQDYIRTARAKGVGPIRVLVMHAFRNTLIPFVTLVGLTLPGILSGSIILEQIFSWPGMGSLFFESLTFRDYPVIMGLVLMFTLLTLFGQLLADVLYAMVDPRVTYN